MNYSEIKQIKSFCETLSSNPFWREVVSNIDLKEDDFEVDGVRFINDEIIKDILEDELASDEYILGSFSDWSISEATGWPLFLIELAQKNGEYEELGKAMTGSHVAELASLLISHDGYGHHFNRYDGSEEEFSINGILYHVFDNR